MHVKMIGEQGRTLKTLDRSRRSDTKFDIQPTTDGLKIEATADAKQAQQLMDEFGKCANGTCSCQSSEYEKVESMQVTRSDDGVSLVLKAKEGQALDTSCVAECLNHTASQIT